MLQIKIYNILSALKQLSNVFFFFIINNYVERLSQFQ